MTHTLDEVQTLLRKHLSENPDTINPTVIEADGVASCLYNGPDDTHCIAGTVLVKDWNFEPWRIQEGIGVGSVITALRVNLTPEAGHLLALAQKLADGFGVDEDFVWQDGVLPDGWHVVDGKRAPRPWGKVLEILEQEKAL